MFDGTTATPIGVGKFDKWFLDNSQRAYWPKISSAINPRRKLVCWAFASTNSGGPIDTILFYNWVAQNGSYVNASLETIFSAASLGVSFDDLTFTDVDTMTVSSDDPSFLGGSYYFAGIDLDHKLGSFSGSPVAATFETGDYALGALGRATVEWFRPITDAPTVTIAGSGAMVPGGTPTFNADVSMQPSGRCPQRMVNGNFVRGRMKIPQATSWSYAKAIDLKAKAAGAR
jgi:hypothetical protein